MTYKERRARAEHQLDAWVSDTRMFINEVVDPIIALLTSRSVDPDWLEDQNNHYVMAVWNYIKKRTDEFFSDKERTCLEFPDDITSGFLIPFCELPDMEKEVRYANMGKPDKDYAVVRLIDKIWDVNCKFVLYGVLDVLTSESSCDDEYAIAWDKCNRILQLKESLECVISLFSSMEDDIRAIY